MKMAVNSASLPSLTSFRLPLGVGNQPLQFNSSSLVLVPTQQDQIDITSLYVDDRRPGQLQSFTDTAAVALASLGQLFTGLLIIAVTWLGIRPMIFHHPSTVKPTGTNIQRDSLNTENTLKQDFEPIY